MLYIQNKQINDGKKKAVANITMKSSQTRLTSFTAIFVPTLCFKGEFANFRTLFSLVHTQKKRT